MVGEVEIAGRKVGTGQPCFIIAEAGVNHNGSVELARQLIDVAVAARADAVKFQTFKAERIATATAPKADYQVWSACDGESQYEMLRRLELSDEAHEKLWDYCQRRGILFMSTPFDELSADFLDDLGMAVFKISSGDMTNLPFLSHVARKRKPMIVSTGMSTFEEVKAAVETITNAGNWDLILLHCVSSYPADPADANLRAMLTMESALNVPIGYSDHTLGIEVPIAAVALGACVIEKHFTLERSLPGPDHRASMEPEGLKALVAGIRKVEVALGHGRKEPAPGELKVAEAARKSLVAARDIPAGTALSEGMIAVKRPGTGLPPVMRSRLVGLKAKQDIPAGSVLRLEMLS